jgi:hypothetical protein
MSTCLARHDKIHHLFFIISFLDGRPNMGGGGPGGMASGPGMGGPHGMGPSGMGPPPGMGPAPPGLFTSSLQKYITC